MALISWPSSPLRGAAVRLWQGTLAGDLAWSSGPMSTPPMQPWLNFQVALTATKL